MHNIDIILQKMFGIMDSIKKQDPQLYTHLAKVMRYQGIYYPHDGIIFKPGQPADRAFFISEGFLTRSSADKNGRRQLLSIFEQNEIKAGPDFMEQKPSEFLIQATGGTFVAYISYDQLQETFRLFPEAQELATLIISGHNRKEAQLRRLFLTKGITLVKTFYQRYPEMTRPGSVLSDEAIASFLRISVSLLREHRAELFRSRQLINPSAKKEKPTSL